MKLLIGFLICFSSATAVALVPQYLIKSQVIVDGKIEATPQIMALEGEQAMIEVGERAGQDGPMTARTKVEVLATRASADTIKLNMAVEFRSGTKTFKAKPSVISKLGEEVTISIADETGKEEMVLKVTPSIPR